MTQDKNQTGNTTKETHTTFVVKNNVDQVLTRTLDTPIRTFVFQGSKTVEKKSTGSKLIGAVTEKKDK